MSELGTTGTAIVRTFVPVLVTALVSVFAAAGLPIDSALLEAVVFALVGTAYYSGVLWLQNHVSPAFGILLGSTSTPDYAGTPSDDELDGDLDAVGLIEDDLRDEVDLAVRVPYEEGDDLELFEGQAPEGDVNG